MLRTFANTVRTLVIDMTEKAFSGHPGMPLGMADVTTILYKKYLRFIPFDASWLNRDRLILSAGHGSALLYSALYLSGYEKMTKEELIKFRQLGSQTPGHPEFDLACGIEATTGPLGQGFAQGVGCALAERILNAKFNDALINHKTYIICSDGCLSEGITQEAISIAGHYQLKNLIVLFDDNEITIDGPTSLYTSEDHIQRCKAAGWDAFRIDGHNFEEIDRALEFAVSNSRPTFIACRTQIGYGSPMKGGTHMAHGSPLGAIEAEATRKALNIEYDPFEVPQDILNEWQSFWKRNESEYKKWQEEFATHGKELLHYYSNGYSNEVREELGKLKAEILPQHIEEATRASSGRALEVISKVMPNIIGGSADLTTSNYTKTSYQTLIKPSHYSGNYIHYGIREHVMAGMMNGISTHGGLYPYGGTFFVFSDYARPAIRLAALMKCGIIYVMTHDSIAVGEDGPTHQPVEHLASFRAMPNIKVIRPCDVIETIEAWELALISRSSPFILVLSRQTLPKLRNEEKDIGNLSAYGAYIIKETQIAPDVTIFASGSEVKIALDVEKALLQSGIEVRVVSIPCMELFFEQEQNYISNILCNDSLKVAIEAGCSFGWEKIIGQNGIFFGLDEFGKTGKTTDLFNHFGLNASDITKKILSVIV